MNPLQELSAAGQSPWLDFVRRTLITSGDLQRLIDDGITGVTSNPSIFGKAIGGSTDYDEEISRIATDGQDLDPLRVFEDLAIADIQMAADVLRPLYDSTDGADGFVSFEVEPRLARDAAGTIEAARRVWVRIDRPNVLIKIPGTTEGLRAIEQAIVDGINVNVTLLFARRGVRRRGRRLPARDRAPGRVRPTRRPGRLRRVVLRLADRLGRGRDGCPRLRAPGHGRDRERQARVPALPRDLLGRTVGAPGRRRRAASNARYGPPPRRRTPPTATPSTSRSSSAPTP